MTLRLNMDFISDSFRTSISLILSLDREVYHAVWTSLKVAVVSTLIASVIGLPAGVALALRRFPLKRLAMVALNTLMALPTVVIGLFVYGLISRQGPFGQFGLLFTPTAMVIGQTILSLPIVIHYTLGSLKGADRRIIPTLMTLGAGPLQQYAMLISEMRFGIMAAVIAGFGRVISEVGVAMILGGNIRGYTRTMTTAIALETSKGEFAFGLALGIILLAVALSVNVLLHYFQGEKT